MNLEDGHNFMPQWALRGPEENKMPMDPELANFYGTNQEDTEKTAAAEMAEDLVDEEDEELDLDDIDPDLLEEAAAAILDGDGGDTAYESTGDEEEKTAEDYGHADRMGRIMAHAYYQEAGLIEKQAGKFGNFARATKDIFTGKQAREGFKNAKSHGKSAEQAMLLGRNVTAKGSSSKAFKDKVGKKAAEHKADQAKSRASAWRGVGKTTAAYGGAGLLAAGVPLAIVRHHKNKTAAAEIDESATPNYDLLVQARAAELLEENGFSPETLEPMEYVKKASVSDDPSILEVKVEQDAIGLLEELGFTFENEAAEEE